MITPIILPRIRLIHISSSNWTIYRMFEIIIEWDLSADWNSNPMFYANLLLQKTINLL